MPIYMKIQGPDVSGDSKANGFENQFELFSFSWGATNPVDLNSGGGGGAGKAHEVPLTVSFRLSAQNPHFLEALATRRAFEKVIITNTRVRQERNQPFEVITLSTAWVTSYVETGTGDLPAVQMTFTYGKIKFATELGAQDTFTWDFITNNG